MLIKYSEISGSHGGEYEDGSILGHSVSWKQTDVSEVRTASIIALMIESV
jgi:hypothetical protein